jgi:Leucine-rich repeat (LRR) protein
MEQAELERIIEQAKMYKLTHLDLNGKNIKILPNSICNLPDLISLGLSGNRLETLPKNIGNLSNLTALSNK